MAYTKQELITAFENFKFSARHLNNVWKDTTAQRLINGEEFGVMYPFNEEIAEATFNISNWCDESIDYVKESIRHETRFYCENEKYGYNKGQRCKVQCEGCKVKAV